jgi:LCP family protein required for cell wall assembly
VSTKRAAEVTAVGVADSPSNAPAGREVTPPLRRGDAGPYGPAVPFRSSIRVPDGLVFVLVAGSDARPGEDLRRTRADSIHLLAANPASGTGTLLGFPRDSWVDIPGHGNHKINEALALGGPDLLAATVRQLTGLPVDYYALTGFEGLQRLVDDMGGVIVPVQERMADPDSGAFFEPGYHRMGGADVLAFSRNRKDTRLGDFSRSLHQGDVMLAALAKLRVEVGDDRGIGRWVGTLLRHVEVDLSPDDVTALAALGRRLDPANVTNIVVPGRVGTAGRASVVYLSESAGALFEDLRGDATVGEAPPPTSSTSTSTSTTSTTLPRTTSTLPLPGGG